MTMAETAKRLLPPRPLVSPKDPPARRNESESPGDPLAKARQRPVRYTIDLEPEQHRFLKHFALRADARASAVIRLLLDELRDNPALTDLIANRLEHRRVQ